MADTRQVPPAEVPGEVAPEPAGNGLRGVLRRRLTETTTWTFLILLGIVAGFAALRLQQFATVFNFRNIAADASGLLIIAVGMTFVIITAGIDLSVGSVLVFSGVIAAKVMLAIGGGGWGAIAAGLVAGVVAGTAWGVVNGVLVTKARVPSRMRKVQVVVSVSRRRSTPRRPLPAGSGTTSSGTSAGGTCRISLIGEPPWGSPNPSGAHATSPSSFPRAPVMAAMTCSMVVSAAR